MDSEERGAVIMREDVTEVAKCKISMLWSSSGGLTKPQDDVARLGSAAGAAQGESRRTSEADKACETK